MKTRIPYRLLIGSLLIGLPSLTFPDEGAVERLREDIAELKAELAELQEEGGNLAGVAKNIETAQSEIESTIAKLPEIEREIEEMGYLYGIYRDSFRLVTSLTPGAPLGSFRLRDGGSVSEGVFIGTVKGAVKVQSSAGVAEIPAGNLPPEIAGQFNVPQNLPVPPEMGYEEMKAAKPLIAKTEAEIEEDQRRAEAAEARKAQAMQQAALEQEAAEEAAKQAEMAARQQSSEKIIDEINALKIQYTDVYNQKKKVRQQKFDQQREFRQAKVKKAQVHVDEVMASFDKEIEKFEDQEDAIKRKISELRSRL